VDSTQQIWATVLSSAGLFTFLGVVANGVIKHVNGTAGRERVRNTGLKQQRDEAWALVREERLRSQEAKTSAEKAVTEAKAQADKAVREERDRADHADERADVEAHNRRLTEEYASQLRRDCTEHGMTDRELRPWPTLRKPPPEQE
jgi:DNA-binding helix-hairpin-helix protein with protein kinase domain